MNDLKKFSIFPDIYLIYHSFGKTANTAFRYIILEILRRKASVNISSKNSIHKTLFNTKYQIDGIFEDINLNNIFANSINSYVISIRNPYTRVLSLYLHITNNSSKPLDNTWKRKMNFFSDEVISFYKFLLMLRNIGINKIDGHTFSIAEKSLLKHADYDYVLRFENYVNDVKTFCENKYGFEPIVKHKGKKTDSSNKIKAYYNKECISLVKEIYADDFKCMGYSTNIEKVFELPNLPFRNKSIHQYYNDLFKK